LKWPSLTANIGKMKKSKFGRIDSRVSQFEQVGKKGEREKDKKIYSKVKNNYGRKRKGKEINTDRDIKKL
jgi:hypothetical protein